MHVRKLQEIEQAEDQGNLIAILMEDGISNIFIITAQKQIHVAKIDKKVHKPNKHHGSKHEQSKKKFFDAILRKMVENFQGDNLPRF